jgi:hypothetical protein
MAPAPIVHGVKPQRLSRRTWLRGALRGTAVMIGLPILDVMLDDSGTALAQGAPLPLCFGTFHWGCGINHQAWLPTTTGRDYQLPYAFESFADLKDYLTLITGFNHPNSSPGHIPARGIALSSSHDMTICQGECVGVYRGQNHPEPSVDVIVADAWAGQAKFDSLELGICRTGPYRSNSSWRAGGTAYNRHETSPQALWDRLFSGGPAQNGNSELLAVTTKFEQSMLDAVMEDTTTLQQRLGVRDRQRLEQHLEGLRALEKRLQAPGAGLGCVSPERPMQTGFGDEGTHEEKEAKHAIMSGLLTTALACDLTRVFSYEWSANQSTTVYWEVGVNTEHHQFSHDAQGSQGFKDICRFIMKNCASLSRQLKEHTEGDRNLLDRTLILGTSEHANAASHDYVDHPYFMVGKAGGGIAAGQHYRNPNSGNLDAPKVLLTAVRAVGVERASLGQPNSDAQRVATQTVAELEA